MWLWIDAGTQPLKRWRGLQFVKGRAL